MTISSFYFQKVYASGNNKFGFNERLKRETASGAISFETYNPL